jgi:hypothetical protein
MDTNEAPDSGRIAQWTAQLMRPPTWPWPGSRPARERWLRSPAAGRGW